MSARSFRVDDRQGCECHSSVGAITEDIDGVLVDARLGDTHLYREMHCRKRQFLGIVGVRSEVLLLATRNDRATIVFFVFTMFILYKYKYVNNA